MSDEEQEEPIADEEQPELSIEEQQNIERAREIAYAKRAARTQQAESLDFQPISAGLIFTASSFLPTELVEALRADVFSLEQAGELAPSGLSKAARASQGFGDADRLVRALTTDLDGDRGARREFERHLDALRRAVGSALGRTLVCAESYYSIHRSGAFLPRHMDEKPEELKGARGWATSHRRSLSWLVYLSGEHDGGAFRGYCHTNVVGGASVGAHEGNLQVGWLSTAQGLPVEGSSTVEDGFTVQDCTVEVDDACDDACDEIVAKVDGLATSVGSHGTGDEAAGTGSSLSEESPKAAEPDAAPAAEAAYAPVYMDSWVMPPRLTPLETPMKRPLSALYTVDASGTREWLTESFDAGGMAGDAATWSAGGKDGRTSDGDGVGGGRCVCAAISLAMALPPQLRRRFSSVEAVPHEGGPPARIIDVRAAGGTLVMFDAVSVPHEVLPTTSGARASMAGCFHEPQRTFPEWFEASDAPLRRSLHDLPAVAKAEVALQRGACRASHCTQSCLASS